MFEVLESVAKLNLIERLPVPLKKEHAAKDGAFFGSFGASPSDMQPEEIISAIKDSHGFIEKES